MPVIKFPMVVLREAFQQNAEFCRILKIPEIGRLILDRDPSAWKELRRGFVEALQKLDLCEVHLHVPAREIHIAEARVDLPPPKNEPAWVGSLTLPIPYLFWEAGPRAWIGFVPMLDTEVFAASQSELAERVIIDVKNFLRRFQATIQLKNLWPFTLLKDPKLQIEGEHASVPSPRELDEKRKSQADDESTLKKIATPLFHKSLSPAWGIDEHVQSLAELLSHQESQSVLLVGPAGVGKTATFHELARSSNQFRMAEFEFWETDGSRLIAGMSGYGEWQARCEKIIDEIEKRRLVLHLGNLIELIEVGKGGGMQVGIADFLVPFIARRKLLAVVECTPEQVALAEQLSPRAVDAFQKLVINVPSPETTRQILLEVAAHEDKKRKLAIEPLAVAAVEQLHRRFAMYSPAPGRMIQFFQNTLDTSESGSVVDGERVIEAFSRQTGLPQFMLSEVEPLDMTQVREHFLQRLIGQVEPVELVVDMLAAVKANLNRPGRPISSFLFVGPTGVGKTEMAKAIAEFMYGDAGRLIRIDMSEYHSPLSAQRLIGGMGMGEGILTGKVREQPFTVLLLDEFEKADGAVFDLLLQVLGEGRLTDGRGQTADFTTTIVIMTSNLGVESFREQALGFAEVQQQQSWREHFINQLEKFVRPEFFNRIDRIVPFNPLSLESMKQITRREIAQLQLRHGITNRRLTMRVADSAIAELAKLGYEPKYGARPLKRALTRRLVMPLAARLNAHGPKQILEVEVIGQKTGMHVHVNKVDTPEEKHTTTEIDEQFSELSTLRRRAQALNNSPSIIRLRNKMYRTELLLDDQRKNLKALEQEPRPSIRKIQLLRDRILELGTSLEESRQLESQLEHLVSRLLTLEQYYVLQALQQQSIDFSRMESEISIFAAEINEQLLNLFLAENPGSVRAQVLMYSRSHANLEFMFNTYQGFANKHQLTTRLHSLHRHKPDAEGVAFILKSVPDAEGQAELAVDVRHHREAATLFGAKDQIGCVLVADGPLAYHWFSLERGVHRFNNADHESVLVEVAGGRLIEHDVPTGIQKLPLFDKFPIRRRYEIKERKLRDEILNRLFRDVDNWQLKVGDLIEETFNQHLDQFVNLWT